MTQHASISLDYHPTRPENILIKLTSRHHPDITIGTIPASHHTLVEKILQSVPTALTPATTTEETAGHTLQVIHEDGRIYALILHNADDPDGDSPLPTLIRRSDDSLNPAIEASLISLGKTDTVHWQSNTCEKSYRLYAPIPHTVSLHKKTDDNTTSIVPVTEIISMSSSEHVLGLMPRHACCLQHATELKAMAEKHLPHITSQPGDSGATYTVEIRRGDHPSSQFHTQTNQRVLP